MSLAAHLHASASRKRARFERTRKPYLPSKRSKADAPGSAALGEAGNGGLVSTRQHAYLSTLAVGADDAEDSGEEAAGAGAGGGPAAYQALLELLHTKQKDSGHVHGESSSSSEDEYPHLSDGEADEDGVRKSDALPATAAAASAQAETRLRHAPALRATAMLSAAPQTGAGKAVAAGNGKPEGAGGGHAAQPERPYGARAAARAARVLDEAEDEEAGWGQRLEEHFGQCASAQAHAPVQRLAWLQSVVRQAVSPGAPHQEPLWQPIALGAPFTTLPVRS